MLVARPAQARVGLLHPSRLVGVAAALALALATLGLVGYLIVFVRHAQAIIPYPFDIDQGEGYDVWAAWLLSQGQPIYTANESYPYFSTNYPPLYFALLAPLLNWLGLSLSLGRLLACAATLLTGVTIWGAAWSHTRSLLAGLLAGLLFLGSTYVYHVGTLARVNTLMVLLAVAGVACAARPTRLRLPLALALLLLAAFTKQTALDALLAVLAYLALRDWRQSAAAGLAAGMVGIAGVAWLQWTSGQAFLLNVVAGNANPWSAWQALEYTENFLTIHGVVALLALTALGRSIWRRRVSVFDLYLALAALTSLSAGKWGAGESYFLETLAALCLVAARALAWLTLHPNAWLRLAAGLMLGVQLLLYVHGPSPQRLTGLRDRGFQAAALAGQPSEADLNAATDLVRRYVLKWDSDVLAEDAGFVIVAGKPVVGNATHLRNLYEAGAWNPAGLVRDLEEKRYGFVVLNAQLYPPPVLAAIGKHYYLYATVAINGYNYRVFAPGAD